MAGGTRMQEHVNWAEKYVERLAIDMDSIKQDMRELRGMEARLAERIEANNKQVQNLVLATIIGIGAMTIAIAMALR